MMLKRTFAAYIKPGNHSDVGKVMAYFKMIVKSCHRIKKIVCFSLANINPRSTDFQVQIVRHAIAAIFVRRLNELFDDMIIVHA